MRSKFVNHYARELLKKAPGKFTTDFDKNKELLRTLDPELTKAHRNMIAGYIVRLLKRLS